MLVNIRCDVEVMLTKQNDCNSNQNHENMVITDERYQSLDANGEPYVSHDYAWNALFLEPSKLPAACRWPTSTEERRVETTGALSPSQV